MVDRVGGRRSALDGEADGAAPPGRRSVEDDDGPDGEAPVPISWA